MRKLSDISIEYTRFHQTLYFTFKVSILKYAETCQKLIPPLESLLVNLRNYFDIEYFLNLQVVKYVTNRINLFMFNLHFIALKYFLPFL